ncbi:MAG: hypothetical protein ICV61_04950 [Microcoleus sp. Co-bin12]|nr:hypothetical protein [Microcoleus sp. Co-bin12]
MIEGSSATDSVTDVTDVSPMSVGRRKKEEAVSCRAFKLHILGGRDAHPTKVLLFFDIQFKFRTA